MNGERGEGCVEDVAWGRGDGDDWLGPVSSYRPVIIMNLSYFSLLLCTKIQIGLNDVLSRSHNLIFILLIKVHLQVLIQQIAKIFERKLICKPLITFTSPQYTTVMSMALKQYYFYSSLCIIHGFWISVSQSLWPKSFNFWFIELLMGA